MRRLVSLLVFVIFAAVLLMRLAHTQTPTTFTSGQTLTAQQLNTAFSGKVDFPIATQVQGSNTTAPASTAFVQAAMPFVLITNQPFNAACDGVTDDSGAINNAIN